jgi:DNA (cytosine-5)-methyltransferase 1
MTSIHKPTSFELFAGAGGLALGIHAAGFKCLGLLERDKFAVETLKDNSKSVLQIDNSSIFDIDLRDASLDFNNWKNKIDLLSGGPPCQPFSTAGKNRGHADNRNMFPAFIQTMARTHPKAIMIENVKGLLRNKFRHYVDYLLKWLEYPHCQPLEKETWENHYKRLSLLTKSSFAKNKQYEVSYQLVDAADFGIPQRRSRVIFTAYRRDLDISPEIITPTHSKRRLLFEQWVSHKYWERHKVKPIKDHLLKSDKNIIEELRNNGLSEQDKKMLPWRTVRDAISDLEDPVPRGKNPIIPNHIQHPGARIYKCHIGSFLDYPAKALKAGTNGTPGGENILRINQRNGKPNLRYFTTREAARLQTFPDIWRFHGTWGACIKQLGNAVPVKLAAIFASQIYANLTGENNE